MTVSFVVAAFRVITSSASLIPFFCGEKSHNFGIGNLIRWNSFLTIHFTFQAVTDLEILNALFQLTVDYFVFAYFGPKAVAFLLGGFFIGSGLHPLAGHYISDHYTFKPGQETYRYTSLTSPLQLYQSCR